MTAVPRLSIVMPLYNAEDYLDATLDGLLGQDFADFELLICDDGSTDGSAALAEARAARDPRITVIRRENRGVPRTVNELLTMVRGAYVTRSDADDVSRPGRLARQIQWLDAHPEIDALGTHALYTDDAGRPIFVPELPLDHEEIDEANLRGRVAFVQSSVMMRRGVIAAVGGYDPHYTFAQDLDLWLRIAEHGRLANLPDVLLDYRFTTSGLSGSKVEVQAGFAAEACQAAWARRGLPPRALSGGKWRPTKDRASRRDFAIKWGWQAWKAGYGGTARHFFGQAVRLDPRHGPAWKALAVATFRAPKTRPRVPAP